jgi:hypothetical protein
MKASTSLEMLKLILFLRYSTVSMGPCHHVTVRPQDADGGDCLQIWSVAVNTLNKQSLTIDTGWSSSLGVGRGDRDSTRTELG